MNKYHSHNKRVKNAPFGRSDARKTRAVYPNRVCQAWYLTRQVQVLIPGIRRAEG